MNRVVPDDLDDRPIVCVPLTPGYSQAGGCEDDGETCSGQAGGCEDDGETCSGQAGGCEDDGETCDLDSGSGEAHDDHRPIPLDYARTGSVPIEATFEPQAKDEAEAPLNRARN